VTEKDDGKGQAPSSPPSEVGDRCAAARALARRQFSAAQSGSGVLGKDRHMVDSHERPESNNGQGEGPLAAGDRVWWDEGAAIGYIRHVLATSDQWEAWGLDEPTLIVAQTSDPSVDSGMIGLPVRTVSEEGIGRLTRAESASADAALAAAAQYFGDAATTCLGISCQWHEGALRHWIVVRYGGDTITAIRFPPSLTPIEPVAKEEVCFLLKPVGGGPAKEGQ
jgi:hypothetical protein